MCHMCLGWRMLACPRRHIQRFTMPQCNLHAAVMMQRHLCLGAALHMIVYA